VRETRVREAGGIAVREWGEPGAPTAMFWHGLGPLASGAFGRELAPALVHRGWRLLAPDAPGFGRSRAREPAAYELDALGALLLTLVDRPVALIGHSWGASLALAAAARRPELVTALVLFDTGHRDYEDLPDSEPNATPEERTDQARSLLFTVPNWDAFVELLQPQVRRALTDTLLGVFREAVERRDDVIQPISAPEVLAAGILGVDRGPRMSSLWPQVAESGLPVLLLTATEPPELRAENAAGARRLLEAIPTAEWREIEDSGHRLLADAGPQVAELVASWLSRS
jgi:pimeloyl-ACP methyl ester carboxylesterase